VDHGGSAGRRRRQTTRTGCRPASNGILMTSRQTGWKALAPNSRPTSSLRFLVFLHIIHNNSSKVDVIAKFLKYPLQDWRHSAPVSAEQGARVPDRMLRSRDISRPPLGGIYPLTRTAYPLTEL